jgi:hypothetical protein
LTTPVRTAGLRGRLPKRPVTDRLPLRFMHEYASLPAPVYPVNVTGGWTAWGMLGNGPDPTCTTHPQGVGDCGFAGREHNEMSKAACLGETGTWETSNQLVTEYLAYDDGQDKGVVLADVLLAWYRAGKILAFAPVDHTDPARIDSAMQAFHGVLVGVNLTDGADDLFEDGQPWTVANGERPDPNDGHVIVKVEAANLGFDTYVTWGAEQQATLGWSNLCVDEVWGIVTREDEVTAAELAAMRADIDALGGTGGQTPPAPAPAPSPSPSPSPSPVPSPDDLLAEIARLIRAGETDLIGWLERNGL